MSESISGRLKRLAFNLFPAYAATGAQVIYIAPDWHQTRVKLPLTWRTRNPFGTLFGGSMYAAVDPMYVVMLTRILGRGYVVWDKAATIRFKRPGRTTLYADFRVTQDDIAQLKAELEARPSLNRMYHVELTDREGVVHATIEKTIYIARRGRTRQPDTTIASAAT